jgi:uncharacterized protein (TIGR02145 family)
MMLAAQQTNGVTVSGLTINSGTVTFNVSWKNTGMPELWSDTVWVFVDYNKNGVMERLPITDATASAGTITKVPNNDKGVWIAGNARTNDSFSAKVELFTEIKDIAGTCAYASNYPPVAEYITTQIIKFTGTPMYDLVLKHSDGSMVTQQVNSPFIVPTDYTLQSFIDKTGAPGTIKPGYNQPQGSCTFTQPPVVGTFANFHITPAYTSSTYVTLTDERDNKNYEVVKIGGRWIMARNLNYQKDLNFNAASNQANGKSFISTTDGIPAIGGFWCPGANNTTSSTRESCEVWGALYSWETAMMLDGTGTWTDITNKYTSIASAGTYNHGRTAHSGTGTGGRGICPPNWHVPTDFEWGVFFDAVEGSGTGTVHQTAASSDWYGADAGKKSKAACTGTTTDDAPLWTDNGNRGTNSYGFRGVPAGLRNHDGSHFYSRGILDYFWSSSVSSSSRAWQRGFYYDRDSVTHYANSRSHGFAVRCIRD